MAALTSEDIERWFDRLGTDRPAGQADGHWVDSIFPIATPDGLILRFKVSGAEPVDLFLNAVVATAVLQSVRKAGQSLGWLDDKDNIIAATPDGPRRWTGRN